MSERSDGLVGRRDALELTVVLDVYREALDAVRDAARFAAIEEFVAS